MSAFGGLILTNKGRALQAKAQAGTQLNFTRMAAGDGQLGGTSIQDLNALIHEVKSLPITLIKTLSGGKALVRTFFSNQDLATGFYFREFGVFAQDPDEGEILYCYGNAGANAEYIPAAGGADTIEKNIDVITIVGNAANVTATIDESLIFVTTQEYNGHLTDPDPHPQYALDADLNALAGAGRTTETVKGNADNLTAHLADTTTAHGINTKVSKSGDTMTGQLNLPSMQVTGISGNLILSETGARIEFSRNDANYLKATSTGGYFKVVVNGDSDENYALQISANKELFANGGNRIWHAGNAGPFYKGSGSPEGNVSAPVGAIYQRTDGGAGTTFYVKESGTGNTGWVAK